MGHNLQRQSAHINNAATLQYCPTAHFSTLVTNKENAFRRFSCNEGDREYDLVLDLLIEAFLHIKFNIFMDHNTFYLALVISVTEYQTNTLSIMRRGQPGSGETIDGGDGSGWPSSSQVGNPFNFWPTLGQWESRQMNNCTDDQTIGPMYKKVDRCTNDQLNIVQPDSNFGS